MCELKIAEGDRSRCKVATVVAPDDDDALDGHDDGQGKDHDDAHVPSAAIKPGLVAAHVPKREDGHNVV